MIAQVPPASSVMKTEDLEARLIEMGCKKTGQSTKMTITHESRLAALTARRETLEAMFYDGVPLQTLCDSVPGVGDQFVRQYLRGLKLDWNRRMLFIEQRRRQRNLMDHEHKERAMQRETDRQAEQWRTLLKGRHFGRLHSRTFIPDRRFAKPAAQVARGSTLSLAAMDAPGT